MRQNPSNHLPNPVQGHKIPVIPIQSQPTAHDMIHNECVTSGCGHLGDQRAHVSALTMISIFRPQSTNHCPCMNPPEPTPLQRRLWKNLIRLDGETLPHPIRQGTGQTLQREWHDGRIRFRSYAHISLPEEWFWTQYIGSSGFEWR